MKGNRTTSSSAINSSSKEETVTSYYLPDECWESIFRFIIINDNYIYDDYDRYHINHWCLNFLSLVSKQFLSITDHLRFSITINKQLKYCHIFKRFTNLTSLNLNGKHNNLDELLCEISCFPLKHLTSLNISYYFPITGFLAFSQKITTLTSLTCSNLYHLNPSYLFIIAKCFPLLEQVDLSCPRGYRNHSSYVDGVEVLSLALIKLPKVNLSGFPINYRRSCNNSNSYVDGVEVLSLALIKLRKLNLTGVPINDQSLFHLFNNCKHLEEFIMNGHHEIITKAGLASAIRETSTLTSLSPSNVGGNYCHIFKRFDNLTSLNLNGCHNNLNELLYKISSFPLKQLTSLNISYSHTFPANGVRAFSQKITTLTSLTCSNMYNDYLYPSDLFLIAECFPLLEQLDMIIHPKGRKNSSSYVDGVEALSIALIKLRKVNLSGLPINNQSLFHLLNNCKHLEEVILFRCNEITKEGIVSALRARTTLRSLTLHMGYGQVFTTSQVIDS